MRQNQPIRRDAPWHVSYCGTFLIATRLLLRRISMVALYLHTYNICAWCVSYRLKENQSAKVVPHLVGCFYNLVGCYLQYIVVYLLYGVHLAESHKSFSHALHLA